MTESDSIRALEERGAWQTRRIVLAKVAGFCFGVRRAVDLTLTARRERPGRIATLGSLVHNEQVIGQLLDAGIERTDSISTLTDGAVVLSAHGVAPSVVRNARERGLNVVDGTCPFVTKVHRAARALFAQGYQIVMVGDQGHTEVKGVIGAAEEWGASVDVVGGPGDVAFITLSDRVGVISQTTHRGDTFRAVVAEIRGRASDVHAINTVCGATDELQDAAMKLAAEVEVVIVVGGKKSANSARLRAICAEQGVPAYQVETSADIDEAWLEGKSVIGLTAGASTPDFMIEEVARALGNGKLPDEWRLHHPDEKLCKAS